MKYAVLVLLGLVTKTEALANKGKTQASAKAQASITEFLFDTVFGDEVYGLAQVDAEMTGSATGWCQQVTGAPAAPCATVNTPAGCSGLAPSGSCFWNMPAAATAPVTSGPTTGWCQQVTGAPAAPCATVNTPADCSTLAPSGSCFWNMPPAATAPIPSGTTGAPSGTTGGPPTTAMPGWCERVTGGPAPSAACYSVHTPGACASIMPAASCVWNTPPTGAAATAPVPTGTTGTMTGWCDQVTGAPAAPCASVNTPADCSTLAPSGSCFWNMPAAATAPVPSGTTGAPSGTTGSYNTAPVPSGTTGAMPGMCMPVTGGPAPASPCGGATTPASCTMIMPAGSCYFNMPPTTG